MMRDNLLNKIVGEGTNTTDMIHTEYLKPWQGLEGAAKSRRCRVLQAAKNIYPRDEVLGNTQPAFTNSSPWQ
jgi:hypothetical protein